MPARCRPKIDASGISSQVSRFVSTIPTNRYRPPIRKQRLLTSSIAEAARHLSQATGGETPATLGDFELLEGLARAGWVSSFEPAIERLTALSR